MNDQHFLIWGLLFAVLILCAWWHIRENRQLAIDLFKNMDTQYAQWVVRFAWSRTLQLLAAIACSIIVIIAYDWQLTESRNSGENETLTIKTLEHQLADERSKEAAQQAQLAAATAAATPTSAPVKTPAIAPGNIAPAAPATPSANPLSVAQSALDTTLMVNLDNDQAASAQQPASESPASDPVEDLYSPERQNNDAQSTMDDIKKRYEDILVLYLFFKKCGKNGASDYDIITAALRKEMVAVHAPDKLQSNIMTSAQGSYQEVYSQSPCDGKGIGALNAQYNDYIRVLSANFLHQQ